MERSHMIRAPRSLSFALPAALAMLSACGGQAPSVTAANQSDLVLGTRVHVMPMQSPSATAISAPASTPYATASDLTYRGGAVISTVKVVQVLWGSGSYLSNLTSASSPNMGSAYAG